MTTQDENQSQRPHYREDYKVQQLLQRIETKLSLKSKEIREASQASSKN